VEAGRPLLVGEGKKIQRKPGEVALVHKSSDPYPKRFIMKRTTCVDVIMGYLLAANLASCGDHGTEPGYTTEPISEDHSAIADPYARWQAYNLTNYAIDQRVMCYCPNAGEIVGVYVRENVVIDVIRSSDGRSILAEVPYLHKTVEELFALTTSVHPDSVDSLVIQYDERFGFPSFIYIDVDARAVDDEGSYLSQGLRRLLP